MVGQSGPIDVDVEVHPDLVLDPPRLTEAAARHARVPLDQVRHCELLRRSIDARRGRVRIHARVRLHLHAWSPPEYPTPLDLPALRGAPRVCIVGAGPAGMFCAWQLARAGVRSVVLERGRRVRERRRDLARLSQRGELDPESNYCFGEGGAGTFSDGKLYTRSHKRGPVEEVLRAFVGYGAPPEILVDARPHIGTNRLPRVITGMREHLESAGVEFRFESRVDALLKSDRRAAGVSLFDGTMISAQAVVLAPGHSAHGIIEWVVGAGAQVEFKPFAVGVRIEHAQAFVDRQQFGQLAGHPALGAAYYRIVERLGDVSAYSFCMCPGGYIVPAATVRGQQVVNGMSPAHRRGRFANSGFVTQVGLAAIAAAGFDTDDPLCGLHYLAQLETRAFQAGGGAFVAPAQRLSDFVEGRESNSVPRSSYHRGLRAARVDTLFGPLADPLREALRRIDGRMPGFCSDEAVAVGVESRTSAPYRIARDEAMQAPGLPGCYPTGEGAGYAGGIVSAALDGIRIARALSDTISARVSV
jgi:hypothetical protein